MHGFHAEKPSSSPAHRAGSGERSPSSSRSTARKSPSTTTESRRGRGNARNAARATDIASIRRISPTRRPCSALVDAVVAEMGGLDILVNNAGIYSDHPIASVSYEEWQAQWAAILADQPGRRGEPVLLRGAAHDPARRRADRQRLVARSVSRRTDRARLRREQSRA